MNYRFPAGQTVDAHVEEAAYYRSQYKEEYYVQHLFILDKEVKKLYSNNREKSKKEEDPPWT